MKLTVLGLGYIGLPTALTFANYGQEVVGVDIDETVIEKLNAGEVHIEEPGLYEIYIDVWQNKRFRASATIEKSDVFIIAVPTPNKHDKYKSCDLGYVEKALISLLPYLEKGNTIIIESTIYPGATEKVLQPIIEAEGYEIGKDIYLAHCPERVLPGNIFRELVENDRIIGGVTEKCTCRVKDIYNLFVRGQLLGASASSAEMSKLMENTFRDVNIALANELVKISDELNLNALEIIDLANKHPRVNIHSPGPGVGGHCLAVDPYFIIAESPQQAQMISKAREINSTMPMFIVDKVKRLMEKSKGNRIALMGLAYKGNVDDVRESPAVKIYQELSNQFTVNVFDPYVKPADCRNDLLKTVSGADLMLILTDHDEFKQFTDEHLKRMNQKIVFDTRNIFPDFSEEVTYYHMGNLPD
ncbi:nucleotide sugar dehydrogenase [Enterococcus rivorum]|uniref:UDP-N-acetyl-D-mannosamine dehydrogenase n=2 Tax=Enterococcus rivorum TaxID=762845 RepID=A0A1E5KSC6_9ENTE|nr:nucleotide sugar dehydrogenase [Enterococcus rivorum]MBP2097446.1 UDP-N-acetyl-D-mannosaminuronic acid dehydrogenase [Enterococcus rivorum]OEH80787.1 UDP-N-acetyl-D-mannosamine dehydrogenase [Enterococcus rivorum]